MHHTLTLTITSLLSIVLMTFHLSDDVCGGSSQEDVRRPFGPHERSRTCRRQERNSNGILFWAWTLLALGVTAIGSVILSARGLWTLQRPSRSSSS